MNTHSLYPRLIEARIAEALCDTPVVLIAGPRQAGKTTLVRQMATQGMRYLTLDDELTMLSARTDRPGWFETWIELSLMKSSVRHNCFWLLRRVSMRIGDLGGSC